MRQPQQKNRMRGRGRKPSNPLSRSFESNGPDVKIRGNASHIADKYASLARDAASSGDSVMAENYLQHAEHYNRIVASANNNQQNQHNQANRNDDHSGNGRGPQPDVGDRDDDGDNNDAPRRAERDDRQQANGRQSAKSESDSGDDAEDANTDAPRREPRSRRRPRKSEAAKGSDNANGHHGNGADNQQPSAEDAASKEMTSDAAKLPGNLLGVSSEDAEGGRAKDE